MGLCGERVQPLGCEFNVASRMPAESQYQFVQESRKTAVPTYYVYEVALMTDDGLCTFQNRILLLGTWTNVHSPQHRPCRNRLSATVTISGKPIRTWMLYVAFNRGHCMITQRNPMSIPQRGPSMFWYGWLLINQLGES